MVIQPVYYQSCAGVLHAAQLLHAPAQCACCVMNTARVPILEPDAGHYGNKVKLVLQDVQISINFVNKYYGCTDAGPILRRIDANRVCSRDCVRRTVCTMGCPESSAAFGRAFPPLQQAHQQFAQLCL